MAASTFHRQSHHDSCFESFLTTLRKLTFCPDPITDPDGETWYGQQFVLADQLRKWLVTPPERNQPTNVHTLLEAVYKEATITPLDTKRIVQGHSQCLFTFCILLEMNHANLIHIFYQNSIVDAILPLDERALQVKIKNALSHIVKQDEATQQAQVLAQDFNKLQWKYFPARFEYGEGKGYGPPMVFPFIDRHLIADKGGTSKVYEVAVPVSFLDKDLRSRCMKGQVQRLNEVIKLPHNWFRTC